MPSFSQPQQPPPQPQRCNFLQFRSRRASAQRLVVGRSVHNHPRHGRDRPQPCTTPHRINGAETLISSRLLLSSSRWIVLLLWFLPLPSGSFGTMAFPVHTTAVAPWRSWMAPQHRSAPTGRTRAQQQGVWFATQSNHNQEQTIPTGERMKMTHQNRHRGSNQHRAGSNPRQRQSQSLQQRPTRKHTGSSLPKSPNSATGRHRHSCSPTTRRTPRTRNHNRRFPSKQQRQPQQDVVSRTANLQTLVLAYHKPRNVITSHSTADALPTHPKHHHYRRTTTRPQPPLGMTNTTTSNQTNPTSNVRRTVYQDVQTADGWIGNANASLRPIVPHHPKLDQDDNENGGSRRDWSFSEITGLHHAQQLHAIGRLDCDTTGLLLLTNDGGLVHHITHPPPHHSNMINTTTSSKNKNNHSKLPPTCNNQTMRSSVSPRNDTGVSFLGSDEASSSFHGLSKTYQVVIMGHYDNDHVALETMRRHGIDIGPKHGGVTLPVPDLTVLDHPTRKSTRLQLTLWQGKNRQVRRMFHAMGSGVLQLHRIRMGPSLDLTGLEQPGAWRVLSPEQVQDALQWTVRTVPVLRQPSTTSSSIRRSHARGSAAGGTTRTAQHRKRPRNNDTNKKHSKSSSVKKEQWS